MQKSLLWLWDSPKLNDLAEANFKRCVAVLRRLIVEERTSFDLLMACGNTGLVLSRYTQMVYHHLNLTPPPLLKIAPVLTLPSGERSLEGSDFLSPDLANQLTNDGLAESSSGQINLADDHLYRAKILGDGPD